MFSGCLEGSLNRLRNLLRTSQDLLEKASDHTGRSLFPLVEKVTIKASDCGSVVAKLIAQGVYN